MKKILLIPTTLVALTMPLMSLCACKKGSDIIAPTFSVSGATMNTTRKATLDLRWEPENDIIEFNEGFAFTSSAGGAIVNAGEVGDGHIPLTLTFNNDIINNSIDDGMLSFHCKNVTSGWEGDINVSEIHIASYSHLPQFTVANSTMSNAKEANIELDWTNPGAANPHDMYFEENTFSFTYDNGSHPKEIKALNKNERPLKLKLTFSEEITENDIEDGLFKFTCRDKQADYSKHYEINDINISKYELIAPVFSVDDTTPFGTKQATIKLNWNTDDTIAIKSNSLNFKYNSGTKEAAKVELITTTKPAELNLTFNEAITDEDITDGVLTFNYEDETILHNGEGKVENISIEKYTPIAPIFSVESTQSIDAKNAYVWIDWTPKADLISFEANTLSFKYNGSEDEADITQVSGIDERPLCLELTFNSEITEDISDGVLSFNYHDKTSGIQDTKTLDSVYIRHFGQEDFNTCSWDKIVNECNMLERTEDIDSFCHAFMVDDLSSEEPTAKKEATSLNDFVGQERTIKVNNNDHKVMVVGCQQDYLDESRQTPIALTFQFRNVICDENGEAIQTSWDVNNRTNNYWNSTLYDFLNNDSSDEESTYSVYKMIAAENDWANSIQSVSRSVLTQDPNDPKLSNQTSQLTHLFPLTKANIFTPEKLEEVGHGINIGEGGEQYSFYRDNIVPGDRLSLPQECLILKDLTSKPEDYWMNSPNVPITPGKNWTNANNVMYNGSPCVTNNGRTSFAVAPCFCL